MTYLIFNNSCDLPSCFFKSKFQLLNTLFKMKNFLLSIILGVLVVLPAMVNAQGEAMAEMPSITTNEDIVEPAVVETPKVVAADVKKTDAPVKIKTTKPLSKRELRALKRACF